MSSFGDPVAGAGAATATAEEALNNAAPQEEMLDPNDPRLTAEAIDVNPEADAYAMPAPPPDGKYRVKLKLMQVEDAKGGKHDYLPKMTNKAPIVPYFFTAIEARIIDPTGKYDNIPLFDRWVGTYVGRDNASKVATILFRLHKPDGTPWIPKGARLTPKEWMDTFVQALRGEPEVGVETTWEWNCQTCGEEAKKAGTGYPKSIKGMGKFPVDSEKSKANGKQTHSPDMKCQANAAHGFSTARATIARFIPISEVK